MKFTPETKAHDKNKRKRMKNIRAWDAVELSLTGQFGVQLRLLELVGVLGLDISMDLVDISHIALCSVFALDITDTLVDTRAAKSSHCDVMKVWRGEVDGSEQSDGVSVSLQEVGNFFFFFFFEDCLFVCNSCEAKILPSAPSSRTWGA